ncbi:hypothetical protein [Nodosilinea sp. P-1105]|uniref:hypothetical protein n=1 Tax=Nodosilinea sp. P-1105 TaxID=2546229 RepID=UPI0014699E46|nr:hypothetical protein [Nodosilinea sp. P-1105]NMF86289.1 hypothetical protein [Nodosilinea sp. P-1105]
MGETQFLPIEHRRAVFDSGLTLDYAEPGRYTIPPQLNQPAQELAILGIDIDPRYGRVVLVRGVSGDRTPAY